MRALHDTTVGLVRRLDIDELLKDIIIKAAQLLDTRNGYLFLTDKDGKRMVMRVGIGQFESLIGFTLQPGQGLVGRVWESGRPIILDDYQSWEHHLADERFEQLHATCGIPLKTEKEVIGVIGLSHFEPERTFRPEELDIMNRFAELAAVALVNARLYSSLSHELAEKQRIEKALRLSEERYRIVVENANDSICIAQDDKFVFFNPRTLELLGCTAEELRRTPFSKFIYPDDLELLLDRYRRRLKGENPLSTYPVRIISKQGDVRWVQLNAVRVEWAGRPAILVFSRDITDQKSLELQLQQAQKMEAIGTLAGGIAHDFNNLLMGIQGRTSILLTDTHPEEPAREHLTGIEEHVKSAADLTRQLLGFARGGKYEVKTTGLNELIAEKNKMFGRTKKEIQIHEKFTEDLWNVDVDRGQIEQVILNIYINAWQAMPGGGKLFIQTENVQLDEMRVTTFHIKAGNYVKISITDTGVGMDPETRQRVFEPFYTTRPMGRGTGLGLASAYGIIRNHGGYITIDSEKGKGTSVTIYLPASNRELPRMARIPEGRVKGQGTILLIDDEQLIIDVGSQLLKRLGYTAITACGGKQALDLFEKQMQNIDLVILDMIMPGMSGSQTFDELKKLKPDIKVILSSGYSLDGEASQIIQRGCSAFIQKPYTMDNLAQQLHTVLNQTE